MILDVRDANGNLTLRWESDPRQVVGTRVVRGADGSFKVEKSRVTGAEWSPSATLFEGSVWLPMVRGYARIEAIAHGYEPAVLERYIGGGTTDPLVIEMIPLESEESETAEA